MDKIEVEDMVKQLASGFEALQGEYQKLFGQHQALERKLANARDQYNELARLYGGGQLATPPLSLASFPGQSKSEQVAPTSVSEILDKYVDSTSQSTRDKVRAAAATLPVLRFGLPLPTDSAAHGVRIWAGPSADKPESSLPSIMESPLEQDFTIEGTPSRLGCPFASMSKRRLSSHAASVLNRYNHNGSVCAVSNAASSSGPTRAKDTVSRRSSRIGSVADPIQAEICAMSDNAGSVPPHQGESRYHAKKSDSVTADAGVCPIRFLDQHSPEEVATYFERHKHELPRSHEICVRRYQSNEDQIRQLDAKYGSLVSMIQGLGLKHKGMLPPEPDDEDELGDDAEAADSHDAVSDEKVRKWASSVSAQAAELDETTLAAAVDGADGPASEEERVPHFERPLRDIRVGESPSRPWGIQIPIQYLEQTQSESSSKPAEITTPSPSPLPDNTGPENKASAVDSHDTAGIAPHAIPLNARAGKCPFGHSAAPLPSSIPAVASTVAAQPIAPTATVDPPLSSTTKDSVPNPLPESNETTEAISHASAATISTGTVATTTIKKKKASKMVFTGPVFIGYAPDDAIRILRQTGLGG